MMKVTIIYASLLNFDVTRCKFLSPDSVFMKFEVHRTCTEKNRDLSSEKWDKKLRLSPSFPCGVSSHKLIVLEWSLGKIILHQLMQMSQYFYYGHKVLVTISANDFIFDPQLFHWNRSRYLASFRRNMVLLNFLLQLLADF